MSDFITFVPLFILSAAALVVVVLRLQRYKLFLLYASILFIIFFVLTLFILFENICENYLLVLTAKIGIIRKM